MGHAISRLLMRFAVGAGAAMIAIAGGMVAITFVIIAIYELLQTVMQPWAAALCTAGLAVLVSALVIVIARIVVKVALPKHPASAKPPLNMSELGALLGKEARGFVETNSWSTLALLAVVGFLFAFSPRLRSLIWKLL
ncbi:MAG TPA: hypothetical protein VMF58_03125 [Rhizomicrobium sp.]|nr:hypothetical protein [Rhizomicrobium sp.]